MRYPAATLARWLRLSGISISLVFPSLYLAIVNFHPELIPFTLLVTIAAAKEQIPFPLVVEILLMEVVFEMLREAGLRMPRPIGQALTIVGPIVIGQAAVQAGLVGAPVIVVVAITAIVTFLIAREKVTQATRILRFPLLILTSLFGMFGLILGPSRYNSPGIIAFFECLYVSFSSARPESIARCPNTLSEMGFPKPEGGRSFARG